MTGSFFWAHDFVKKILPWLGSFLTFPTLHWVMPCPHTNRRFLFPTLPCLSASLDGILLSYVLEMFDGDAHWDAGLPGL